MKTKIKMFDEDVINGTGNRNALLERIADQQSDEDMMERKFVSYEELSTPKHATTCWACYNVNNRTLQDDDTHLQLFKLFSENRHNLPSIAIASQMSAFYDKYLLPSTQKLWPLDCIYEHITMHSFFPSDEIIEQIKLLRTLRNKLRNNCVQFDSSTGTHHFDQNNIKLILNIGKDIRALMESKSKIPEMLGFSAVLKY